MSVLSVPILIRGRHIWDTLRMPEEEFHNRRSKMREHLAGYGLDGIMCYADSSCNGFVEYFTNYNCVQPFTNAMLIFPVEGDLCLVASVPPRDAQRIRGGFIPGDVELLTVGMSPLACDHVGQKAVEYLTEKGLAGKRWGGVNLSRCMKKALDDLERAVPGIVDLTEDFEKLRAVKSTAEIQIISQAASMARLAVMDVLRACREGSDECEAAARADHLIRCAGAEDIQLFIGTSESGGFLRPPRKRFLKNGEIIKVLCQVQCLRYRGQFAASAVVGEGPSRLEPQGGKYGQLLGRIAAGIELSEAWKTELGAEKNTYTSIHGVGQDLVESPYIGAAPVRLEENTVLGVTWESHKDCAIFADTILCTKTGAVSLSGHVSER